MFAKILNRDSRAIQVVLISAISSCAFTLGNWLLSVFYWRTCFSQVPINCSIRLLLATSLFSHLQCCLLRIISRKIIGKFLVSKKKSEKCANCLLSSDLSHFNGISCFDKYLNHLNLSRTIHSRSNVKEKSFVRKMSFLRQIVMESLIMWLCWCPFLCVGDDNENRENII